MGRFSSIDLVLDCMGIIHPYITYGKRYIRIFFTIDYEGVIVMGPCTFRLRGVYRHVWHDIRVLKYENYLFYFLL